MTAKNESLLD